MNFGSSAPGRTGITKLHYAQFLAAALAYLANIQRDAAGLIVFDDTIQSYVHPSTRQGQLARLLHAIENVQPGTRTDFARPFFHVQEFLHRRGVMVAISDFWENPEKIIQTVAPLRFRGNELVLFHILDPEEIRPKLKHPVLLEDMETGDTLEVSPDYASHEYRHKMDTHLAEMETRTRGAGIDYFLIDTSRPLDAALREYLSVRKGRM
jgi:uncharacterized protein (DUF58 family)